MIIGLDFDNTIACYDRLFHRLAAERISFRASYPRRSNPCAIISATGREDDWTELQGLAYGPRIVEAEPFAGVMRFLSQCRSAGFRVAIISHKSRHPYRGAKHDLHAAAHAFLRMASTWRLTPGCHPTRAFRADALGEARSDRFARLRRIRG